MTTLVQHYFSQSAASYPDKVAVSCEDESITYSDLERFSNAFSRELKEQGAKRGEFIAFFMKKSISSIKSILSILKADCAYIPVDANSPGQRLQSILTSGEISLLIVDNESEALIRQLLAESVVKLVNVEQFSGGDSSSVSCENLSIDLAYVLFTSGSTGTPKGVMIPHGAITDYIDWCVETYRLTSDDVIANHAPLYFDNSTFDLYTAFKTGATLHLVHEELNLVFPRLIKWLDQRKATTFFCVPSVLTLLLKTRRLKPESLPHLRHIICAGEALPVDALRQWMTLYPHIQFTNMYGPTEITVDCSYHIVSEVPDDGCKSIPIGKARNNMELFVRQDDGSLSQQPGAQGELLVRGASVAYGYLGDSERTEQAFIQNPLNRHFNDPLYCTGDLVCLGEAGVFDFLGRADDQIKHLGYRIELGEIEVALLASDAVSEGLVVFNNTEDESEREIGALVKLRNGASAEQLQKVLKDKLPSYMVPTRVALRGGDMPRTPNGKYDRKAALKQVFC